jgi:hypothetical protein
VCCVCCVCCVCFACVCVVFEVSLCREVSESGADDVEVRVCGR